MAAAPVAAVAPKVAPIPAARTTLSVSLDATAMRESVRDMIGQINAAIADGYRLDGLPCSAQLSGGIHDFNTREDCTIRPPEGLSRSPADGRSDARCERVATVVAAALGNPAAASDQPFSDDRVNEFMKLARAM